MKERFETMIIMIGQFQALKPNCDHAVTVHDYLIMSQKSAVDSG